MDQSLQELVRAMGRQVQEIHETAGRADNQAKHVLDILQLFGGLADSLDQRVSRLEKACALPEWTKADMDATPTPKIILPGA